MPKSATVRLEARISADLHAMLKRAAELQGCTEADFVVNALQEAARQVTTETEVVRLPPDDQRCVAQALLSPPEPAAALRRAFERRGRLLGMD